MFSLSKGEPPTPPSTNATPSTDEIGITPSEFPQLQKIEAPNCSQSIPIESTSTFANKPTTESGMAARELPPIRKPSGPLEPDSGFEASPCSFTEPGRSSYFFDDDVFEKEDDRPPFMLEREDNWCPDCCEDSSCSCSRAESSATVRAAIGCDPNTCDSDCSDRSPSPQSPPPSSWPIPASCNHIHNDRLPCPRCSRGESLRIPTSSMSCLQNIVASRSYPGSYPASVLNWWNQSSTSVFSPRVAAALSRTSNRSDDRRSCRSRRSQGDSETPSSSSLSCDEQSDDEQSDDELFPCEGGPYLGDLGNMGEVGQMIANDVPEHLRDVVPIAFPEPEEPASRRSRSQSVSIPLDHDYLREIGISLRRLSNEFENRMAERNRQRRSSLAQYFNW